MASESEVERHRELAISLFNHVWTLIEMDERTAAEVDEMIHAAHASRHHWGIAGTPLHCARGEWQISRVYSALGRGEAAGWHARRYLEYCESDDCPTFDKAFAHEGMARAAAISGKSEVCASHIAQARQLASVIEDAEDQSYLLGELATISG